MSRPKVLIVDDINENLQFLEKVLERGSFSTYSAESGAVAFELVKQHDFSLIVLDVHMSQIGGLEVAQVLKTNASTAPIPILFITSMDRDFEMEEYCYRTGAVDFLYRPFDEFIFISKARSLIDLYGMKRDINTMLTTQSVSKPYVLAVDDVPENLVVIEKILKKTNINLIKACSGNEALTYTLDYEFALIILDVQMAEMSGYEVAETLKADERTYDIPIIFVTAIDREESKEIKGYDKGAIDFIFKPFNEYVLLSKVKIFLDIYKTKKGLEDLVAEQTKELRDNEERYRSLVSNMQEAVYRCRFDSNLSMIFISDQIFNISGYSADSFINNVHRTFASIIFPDDRAMIREVIERAIGKKESYSLYYRIVSNSGGMRWVHDKGIPVFDNDQLLYLDGFIIDVTERKRAEDELKKHKDHLAELVELRTQELRDKNAQLEETIVKLKTMQNTLIAQQKLTLLGSLFAGIAHEIKNPLNFINNSAKMIQSAEKELSSFVYSVSNETGQDTTRVFKRLKKLKEASILVLRHGDRINNVVQTMQKQGRLENVGLVSTNLNELIETSLNLSYHSMRANDPFIIEPEVTLQAIGDVNLYAQDLSKAFLNIFNNSFYALNKKLKEQGDGYKPELSVTMEKNDNFARIKIWDNGVGISSDDVDHIFDPFVTTKPAGKGIGLGLSISYNIIAHHQGRLEVNSTKGEFTELQIILPLDLKE